MKIKELKDGMRKVDITARVLEVSEPREVISRFSGQVFRVADAIIGDETGTIKLTLWNEQIEQVKVNDTIKIENGYVRSFRGERQLNVGKFGKITVL
ncbi:DNA-binding protein [Candidatus Bathyarchaeota archaeon]|nr:DNA-binding protein [Candidatus Bathyarchaeota archaeon]